ncbi:HECT-type E3 ubiquitin transferase [Entamoeba marina]
MDTLMKSLSEGCGNPFCTNKHCISNPKHEKVEGEISDFVVMAALTSFDECIPYIPPQKVDSLGQSFFTPDNLSNYMTVHSFNTSFRTFTTSPTTSEIITTFDYYAAIKFFTKLIKYAPKNTVKDFFDFISIEYVDFTCALIFLLVPYNQNLKYMLSPVIRRLSNREQKEIVTQFIDNMEKDVFESVFTLIHSYLVSLFEDHPKSSSNRIPTLIEALRIYQIIYFIDVRKKYIGHQRFYIPQINVSREWTTDFDNFIDGKEGLLDYCFAIELFTRVLILHKQNQIEQNFTIQRAVQRNFMEIFSPYLELTVDRNHLLQTSLLGLSNKRPQDFKKELKIQFEGEVGVDAGGVSKEWFSLITKEIFNVEYGMFTYNKTTRQYWFNPNSEDYADFQLIGIVLGLAIYNNIILDISFPIILFKKLLNIPLTYEDYEILDPEGYSSLIQLLQISKTDDINELELDFEALVPYFDTYKSYDLIENGRNVSVTNDNFQLYLDKYTDFYMSTSVTKQFNAFHDGFNRVVTSKLIQSMRPEELELVICGVKTLDFDALEKNTKYKGYTEDSKVVKDFWSIVKEFDDEKKKLLLTFVTANDRVPVGGLGNLNFAIVKYGDVKQYPTASTCFNLLNIPPYDSREVLKERLIFAIENSRGFGLA